MSSSSWRTVERIAEYKPRHCTQPGTWAWSAPDVTGFSPHVRINVPADTCRTIAEFAEWLRKVPQVAGVEKCADKAPGGHKSPYNLSVTLRNNTSCIFGYSNHGDPVHLNHGWAQFVAGFGNSHEKRHYAVNAL